MKILDLYILFSYLKKLTWAIIAATLVFIVVDLVDHFDRFIDADVTLPVIFRYYYLFIPYVIYLIMPAATLLATLFTIGGMTMSNELTAIKVSGISFYRPLMILILTSSLCAYGIYVLGETVIPHTNQERMDIYRYEVKKLPRENRALRGRIYVQIGKNSQLYIDNYHATTREAVGIKILDIEVGRVTRRVDADKMIWRDNLWFVQGAIERHFNDDGSVRWQRRSDITVSGSGLRPDEFEKVLTKPEEMNAKELKEFIDRLKYSGGTTLRWEVELLSKAAMPTAAVIIVLFGAPIAAVRRRGGTAFGFGISLFICFIYFGFIQVGKVLGYNGTLNPWISAWIGNIVFGILGLFVLAKTSS